MRRRKLQRGCKWADLNGRRKWEGCWRGRGGRFEKERETQVARSSRNWLEPPRGGGVALRKPSRQPITVLPPLDSSTTNTPRPPPTSLHSPCVCSRHHCPQCSMVALPSPHHCGDKADRSGRSGLLSAGAFQKALRHSNWSFFFFCFFFFVFFFFLFLFFCFLVVFFFLFGCCWWGWGVGGCGG